MYHFPAMNARARDRDTCYGLLCAPPLPPGHPGPEPPHTRLRQLRARREPERPGFPRHGATARVRRRTQPAGEGAGCSRLLHGRAHLGWHVDVAGSVLTLAGMWLLHGRAHLGWQVAVAGGVLTLAGMWL